MNESDTIQQARQLYRPYGPQALMVALEQVDECCCQIPEICIQSASKTLWDDGWLMPIRCCARCYDRLVKTRGLETAEYEIRTDRGAKLTWEALYRRGKVRLFYPRKTWGGLGGK